MAKEKQVNIKFDKQTAMDVLQVLQSSTYGYSIEFPPERIIRLREVIGDIEKQLP